LTIGRRRACGKANANVDVGKAILTNKVAVLPSQAPEDRGI
jgi:hypothetical protein